MRITTVALAVLVAAVSLSAETWTFSTIDNAGLVGQHAAVATRFEKTHVAYYDVTNGDLKYAVTTDDKTWKIETVDKIGNVGEYASIAVDLKGRPHISYYDGTNHDVKYAMKDGGLWTIAVVDPAFVGWFTAIAVDSTNRAYISYLDVASYDLKVAYGKPGAWAITLVDAPSSVGWGTSVAVDKNGRAHVSHNDNATNKLRYANNVGGPWVASQINANEVSVPTAIAVDANGFVHVAFLSYGFLYYATNANGPFAIEPVDESIGPQEYDLALALTEGGKPVISYYAAEKTQLRLARKTLSGPWQITPLDHGGSYNAVCVGQDGRIRIAYFDFAQLRYAIN